MNVNWLITFLFLAIYSTAGFGDITKVTDVFLKTLEDITIQKNDKYREGILYVQLNQIFMGCNRTDKKLCEELEDDVPFCIIQFEPKVSNKKKLSWKKGKYYNLSKIQTDRYPDAKDNNKIKVSDITFDLSTPTHYESITRVSCHNGDQELTINEISKILNTAGFHIKFLKQL